MGSIRKQRRKIPDREGNWKSRHVLDRKDIHKEDWVDWLIFLTLEDKRKALGMKLFEIKTTLGIPNLDPTIDCMAAETGYGPFMLREHWGLRPYSHFILDDDFEADALHKLIYNNILIPYRWSYNFYPFLEYIVLYGEEPTTPMYANPNLFLLYKENWRELCRTPQSMSDINFLREQTRLHILGDRKQANDKESKVLEFHNRFFDLLANAKKTSPKNIAFKICAFRVFRDMQPSLELEREKDAEYDSDHFLKNQISIFKEYYKEWKDHPFYTESNLSDESIHNRLKKQYREYKKLLTK